MLIKSSKGDAGLPSNSRVPDLNNQQAYKTYYWQKPASDKYRENIDKIDWTDGKKRKKNR
jgi:hypothetical protein